MRSLSPGTINIRVLCKQLNRTVLFCGSNVSRTSSIFLLPWCVSSLPRWVGMLGFGQACWLDVEPSLFPVPVGEVDLSLASLGEDPARTHHNLPIVPTPASSSGGLWVSHSSAATLPGKPAPYPHLDSRMAASHWSRPGLHLLNPSPLNQHTCWAQQPCVSSPAATMVPPPEKIGS